MGFDNTLRDYPSLAAPIRHEHDLDFAVLLAVRNHPRLSVDARVGQTGFPRVFWLSQSYGLCRREFRETVETVSTGRRLP